jgi:hypothetical protein
MRDKPLILLGAAAAAALGAAVLLTTERPDSLPPGSGQALFPVLAAAVNDVARIELTGARGPTTLTRTADGGWTVAERGDYPAGRDAVKNLVVGLAAATLAEPRTASPELYPRIGVEDPETPGTPAVRVVLRRADGGDLGAVVVGKPANPSSIGSGPGQVYLRRAGEAQSWLATTPLDPLRADPTHWLDKTLPRPTRDEIVSLEVREPSGAVLRLKRGEGAQSKAFFAEGLPPGAPLDEQAAEEATGALAFLTFEDVGAYDPLLFAMSPMYVYKTRDGGTVRVRAAGRDGATWLELSAEGGAATEAGKFSGRAYLSGRAYRVYDGTGEILARPVAGFIAPKTAE